VLDVLADHREALGGQLVFSAVRLFTPAMSLAALRPESTSTDEGEENAPLLRVCVSPKRCAYA
jgi:hypothetical protein